MAEVTVNSRYYNIVGSKRSNLYNVSGSSGDVLTTGMLAIKQVNVQPVATNPPTVAAVGGVVTFTSGGAFASVPVEVIGN